MLGLQECKTASEVRELYKKIARRKHRQLMPLPPAKIQIRDLTPRAIHIPIHGIDIVPDVDGDERYPTLAEIVDLVAGIYRVSRTEIVSKRRDARIVLPRQIAAYLAATMTRHSFPMIGRHFGGRDHSTLVYARDKITAMRQSSSELDEKIADMERKLGGVKQIIRGGAWAVYPNMEVMLRELVVNTMIPWRRIAMTLNREFGTSLSEDACEAKASWLGIKGPSRRPNCRAVEAA